MSPLEIAIYAVNCPNNQSQYVDHVKELIESLIKEKDAQIRELETMIKGLDRP